MRVRHLLPVVAFSALLIACQPQTPPETEAPAEPEAPAETEVDLETQREALLQTDQAWSEVAAAGTDIDAIIGYWADDATVYPPGSPPVEGKEAIREFVTRTFETPGFTIEWQPQEVVLSSEGDLGYVTGTNRVTMHDAESNPVTTPGHYVTIWRQDEDGLWKCVVDFWNASPEPGAESGAESGPERER